MIVNDPQNYEELCVAFLKAVKRGDVPAMEVVAQLGVRLTPTPQSLVNIRGMWDSTPLVYATQYAHAAAAHWLLARGADVLAQNEKGVTALLLASLEGMTDACEKILSVAALMGSANSTDSSNRDERGLTAPRSVDQQVGVVYNSAADVNMRLSPLLAVSMNGHAGVMVLLLAHGADPNRPVGSVVTGGVAVGAKQFTLLLAAKYGHVAVLELLLAHGVDCSVRDTGSSHAVLLACENRREDSALLLLRHAAYDQVDSNGDLVARRNVWLQPNRHGLTALHLAATHGLVAAARALVSLARQQSVLDCGDGKANKGLREYLDAVSVTRGETALLMACRKRQFEVARVLLEAGADSARADRGGTTPAQVLERSEQSKLLAMCRAATAASNSPTVAPAVSVGVAEPESSTVPGSSPSVAPASTSGSIADADDRRERNSHDASVPEQRNGEVEEPVCKSRGEDAEEGDGQTAPSSDACDQVSEAEAERSPGSELDRLGDSHHEDGAGGEDEIAKCLEIESRGESTRDGDGDGGSAVGVTAEFTPPPVVKEDLGTTIADLAADASSISATPPTTAGVLSGVTDALDMLSVPDPGSSFAQRELDLADNGTAVVSGVVPTAPTTGEIDRVVPLDAAAGQLAGGTAALAGDVHEPTILPLIAIECDVGAVHVEHSSPQRKETDGDDDERASSTASVSPKKEKIKKSSKRKKKRDKSDQDQPSPPSSTRHHRRHRHKPTEESTSVVAVKDADAAVGEGEAQATVVERTNRRTKERTGSNDGRAQVT